MSQFLWNPWGGGGGSGSVMPLDLALFENNSPINEVGTIVDSVTFNWKYSSGRPSTQNITPKVGLVSNSVRRVTLNNANITDNTSFTLEASDGTAVCTAETKVNFYYPTFVGLVKGEVPVVNEIAMIPKKLIPAESFIGEFICEDDRPAIAIHSSLPNLSDIKETVFGLSFINKFVKYDNIYLTTACGSQPYKVYIYDTIMHTMGLIQKFQFIF